MKTKGEIEELWNLLNELAINHERQNRRIERILEIGEGLKTTNTQSQGAWAEAFNAESISGVTTIATGIRSNENVNQNHNIVEGAVISGATITRTFNDNDYVRIKKPRKRTTR